MANKLISIKTPVLEALGDMGIDHGKNIPDLIRWSARAENAIGSYYSYRRKISVLTVDKYRAELPCEAQFVQRVLLGDYGCDCANLFDLCRTFLPTVAWGTSADSTFLCIDKPDGCTSISPSGIRFEVQDNHIVLNSNYDKKYLTVQYLGLETDLDGMPKVGENHLEAIVAYIMYRYAQRSRFTQVKMDLGDIQLLDKKWNNLCADARAQDAELSESDRSEIVGMMWDPLIGYGLSLNMHNTNDYGNYFGW